MPASMTITVITVSFKLFTYILVHRGIKWVAAGFSLRDKHRNLKVAATMTFYSFTTQFPEEPLSCLLLTSYPWVSYTHDNWGRVQRLFLQGT